MLDTHIHSTFSHDGSNDLIEIVKKGRQMGLKYLAITEHLDLDVKYSASNYSLKQLDLDSYQKGFERAREYAGNDMEFAFGVECGYSKKASAEYVNLLAKYPFDIVLNSVHLLGGIDLYFMSASEMRSKKHIYSRYLNAVLESLYVPYDYQVVAHLGYVMRYVDFDDKSLLSAGLDDLVDEILLAIIEKDKCLELNASVKNLGVNSLPEYEVVKRYYELGGRNISYASDAHSLNRFMAGYEEIAREAKEIGFTEWTAYKGGKALKFPI